MKDLERLVLPGDALRAKRLLDRIERTEKYKMYAAARNYPKRYAKFHNLQQQAKLELRKLQEKKKEHDRFERDHNSALWVVQDTQRRGLVSAAKVVARAHMIPLDKGGKVL